MAATSAVVRGRTTPSGGTSKMLASLAYICANRSSQWTSPSICPRRSSSMRSCSASMEALGRSRSGDAARTEEARARPAPSDSRRAASWRYFSCVSKLNCPCDVHLRRAAVLGAAAVAHRAHCPRSQTAARSASAVANSMPNVHGRLAQFHAIELPMMPTATISTPSRCGKSFRTNRSWLGHTRHRFTRSPSMLPAANLICCPQCGHASAVDCASNVLAHALVARGTSEGHIHALNYNG